MYVRVCRSVIKRVWTQASSYIKYEGTTNVSSRLPHVRTLQIIQKITNFQTSVKKREADSFLEIYYCQNYAQIKVLQDSSR